MKSGCRKWFISKTLQIHAMVIEKKLKYNILLHIATCMHACLVHGTMHDEQATLPKP